MLGHGMRIVVIGLALGLVLSLIAARWLDAILFQVAPNDPFTFFACAAMLAGVALAAILGPARRAASIDPAAAIRHE